MGYKPLCPIDWLSTRPIVLANFGDIWLILVSAFEAMAMREMRNIMTESKSNRLHYATT
jgi:hypothetical protein